MGTIGLRVTVGGSLRQGLGARLARLADLEPAMTECAARARARVALEFEQRAWFSPSGGTIPWAPTHAFGRRSASASPLVSSGAYFAALEGRGAGAINVIGPRSFKIGADGAAFPYAHFHRGGTGATIRTTPWIIRPKATVSGKAGEGVRQWSMFWKLGLTFGAWLSKRTLEEGLRLPPRPHLTRHPELVRQCVSVCRTYVLTGNVAAAA